MNTDRSNDFVDNDSSSQANSNSLIAQLVERYKNDPEKCKPVTMREYMMRMSQIPRLAANINETKNAFVSPGDLSPMVLRIVTGFLNYRLHSASKPKELEKEISLRREMLLLAFEAKPRHISFAMNGYTASDFISYIYQDVAMTAMGVDPEEQEDRFVPMINDIKSWMRIPPPKGITNTARRHIRRRLMLLLDRSNHQAASLFEDREMPSEMVLMMQKLLERDDDQGYLNGELRDFRQVRDDFNILAEFCVRNRYTDKSAKSERVLMDLEKVICPSEVGNFESYVIDLPRGRYVNGKPPTINDAYSRQQRKLDAQARKTIASGRKKAADKKAEAKAVTGGADKATKAKATKKQSDALDLLDEL